MDTSLARSGRRRIAGRTLFSLLLVLAAVSTAQARTVTDAMGRAVDIPDKVDRVICSGPGCLRLLCYLQAQGMAVAVDDAETRKRFLDARPYALANPQFKKMDTFGEFRGHDNPELILSLSPQPQVIFKTYGAMGHDPVELQQKTGVPVVSLDYGDLGERRDAFYNSLRLMADVIGKAKRAEEVTAFFDAGVKDLASRTADIPADQRPTVFVGGVAHRGPHGFQSTEPGYPPFSFVNVRNLAYEEGMSKGQLQHSDAAKEKIVEWDPDVLFLDLSTLQMGADAGGLYELRTDPAYRSLTAVRQGNVYGLLPYNWYTANYGSVLANAWFIGKTVYPDRFKDTDPEAEADRIYTFLVGEPVFRQMDALFSNLAFTKVPMQ
jgi:iron complex transport system substrate-binding protein